RMIKSEIISQMAKASGLNWAIYPGAPDGKGGFQDGDELLPPDQWNTLKRQIGITEDMEKDDNGVRVSPATVTRAAFEYALRAFQTEDANDLIKVGMLKPTFQDNDHFSIDYLRVLSRVSSAAPDVLLRASPQFYEETLGIIGHTPGGAAVFKNEKFQRAFEHGMTTMVNGKRVIRPEYETMWLMMSNRNNGIVRPQEATQTGATYVAFSDDGSYKVEAVTKPGEPTGKVFYAHGGGEMEIPAEGGTVDVKKVREAVQEAAQKDNRHASEEEIKRAVYQQFVDDLSGEEGKPAIGLAPVGTLASNPVTEEVYKKRKQKKEGEQASSGSSFNPPPPEGFETNQKV
ncbi:hypothetical protein KGQ24_02585, partial [Patescibacteria group bacterium]|nr:hypothetical protein [Patescibacteria group bacterium]